MTISKILAGEPIKFHKISTEMGMEILLKLFMRNYEHLRPEGWSTLNTDIRKRVLAARPH